MLNPGCVGFIHPSSHLSRVFRRCCSAATSVSISWFRKFAKSPWLEGSQNLGILSLVGGFTHLNNLSQNGKFSSSSGEHKKYVSNHLPVLSWLSLLFLFNQLLLLAIEGRVNQRTEVWNTVIISSGPKSKNRICTVSKPAASIPNMPPFPWEDFRQLLHLHRSKGGSTFPTAWDLEWL